MVRRSNGRTKLTAGAMLVCIMPAVSGCVGHGGGNLEPTLAGLASLQEWEDPSPFSSDGVLSTGTTAALLELVGQDDPSSPSGGVASTDGTPSRHQRVLAANSPGDRPGGTAVTDTPGGGAADQISTTSGSVISTGIEQESLAQAEQPRRNREAADLLDHWGHRRVQSVVEGLSLRTAAPEADGAGPQGLRAAAQAREGTSLAPNLHAGDEVRLLGSRHGVAYGRWTGGPADTLSIEFDLSRARPAMRYDPAFRALLERSGKAWSRRIADTWASWDRTGGDLKGWLLEGGDLQTETWVGPRGEVSHGLEIDIADKDPPNNFAGYATMGAIPPRNSWAPRFGSIGIGPNTLMQASEEQLFATLAHEIGHLLGAWAGPQWMERYAPYSDTESGTWKGPNVAALHGRAAPFQDAADPHAWVDGERSPLASEFDLFHSGVCSSLMAYCNHRDPRPTSLPHAIDFAFLSDLGMTVTDETDRPETYGLVGWTDYAGFSFSVSRDLRLASRPNALDVTDLLQVEVDVFGLRSTGDIGQSYAAEGLSGTVRYAGGLLGAAGDRTGVAPGAGGAG
ncbi:MAG: hypothetical protein OXC11_00780, partial [Rhodospirillales bacterium]|nr:hypothetical protein [Rhodospirillales bacterium]